MNENHDNADGTSATNAMDVSANDNDAHDGDDIEFAEFLRAFFSSDAGKGEVAEELATAISHGITGVPTYVINGQWSIPGAQDSETFERVLRRTAERSAS